MNKLITVGISDLNIARNGDELITYALGSCVGICLYDPILRIAGLSHILLPLSTGYSLIGNQSYKFADSAIPLLIEKMERQGAHRYRMKAKIAGGAQMFASINNSDLANIGQRNIEAVKAVLYSMNIPLIAEHTGKNYGRTQKFSSDSGLMTIKSINRGEIIL